MWGQVAPKEGFRTQNERPAVAPFGFAGSSSSISGTYWGQYNMTDRNRATSGVGVCGGCEQAS